MVTLAEVQAERARREQERTQTTMRGAALAGNGSVTIEDIRRERARRASAEREQQRSPGYQRAMRDEVRRGVLPEQNRVPIISDFNDFTSQIGRNIGVMDELRGGAAFVGQGAQNLGRRALGMPIEVSAGEAGQAAMDFTRQQQREYAQRNPGLNTAATVAGIATVPAVAVNAPISAARAGVSAMGVQAPFAFGRQEGTLQERASNPWTWAEIGSAGVLSYGGQAIANGFAARAANNQARSVAGLGETPATRAARFEAAGVRPTAAATNQGAAAGVTQMISENLLAGAPARARLRASVDDTTQAVERTARGYAPSAPREVVGENIQSAVRRFAGDTPGPRAPSPATAPSSTGSQYRAAQQATPSRDIGFSTKADMLYGHVFRQIEAAEGAINASRSQQARGRFQGQTGAPIPNPVSVTNTRAVLDDILGSVNSPRIAGLVADPQIVAARQALSGSNSAVRFGDLRALRTYVRGLQSRPMLRQGVDDAGLQRLEAALTQDIMLSARALGGDAAANALARVDRFYAAGMQRINTTLQRITNAPTPRAAYERVLQMASDRSGQSTRELWALRRTLNEDEWRQVAATVIDNLGNARPGAPGVTENGFSVASFVTQYQTLSPEGRRVLFSGANGARGLEDALDNLVHVADAQRRVAAMANNSRSGITVQNVGTGAGLLNPATALPTAGLLLGMTVTGEMLTNPAFVRWVASAARPGQTTGGLQKALQQLAILAGRDPALVPFLQEMSGVPSLVRAGEAAGEGDYGEAGLQAVGAGLALSPVGAGASAPVRAALAGGGAVLMGAGVAEAQAQQADRVRDPETGYTLDPLEPLPPMRGSAPKQVGHSGNRVVWEFGDGSQHMFEVQRGESGEGTLRHLGAVVDRGEAPPSPYPAQAQERPDAASALAPIGAALAANVATRGALSRFAPATRTISREGYALGSSAAAGAAAAGAMGDNPYGGATLGALSAAGFGAGRATLDRVGQRTGLFGRTHTPEQTADQVRRSYQSGSTWQPPSRPTARTRQGRAVQDMVRVGADTPQPRLAPTTNDRLYVAARRSVSGLPVADLRRAAGALGVQTQGMTKADLVAELAHRLSTRSAETRAAIEAAGVRLP